MKQLDLTRQRAWLTRPLCRRYAVGIFRVEAAKLDSGPLTFRWGLGSLPNGELEVFGAWADQDDGNSSLSHLYHELHARGAEVIRVGLGELEGSRTVFGQTFASAHVFHSMEEVLEAVSAQVPARHRPIVVRGLRTVVHADDADAARFELQKFQGSALGERYPDVARLWGEALAGFTPIFSLSEQLRALIRSTDQKAAQVRDQLTRAIARHGPFTDSAAALDFVATSLARTEQRWDRERAAARATREPKTSRGTARRSGALGVTTLA